LERVYAALALVPLFRNVRREDIKFERLSGALTNVSYKVTVGRATYVLRLAGEGTSDYIDRAAEKHNAKVAAAAGINVEVIYFDAENGTMVTRFVEGISRNGGQDFSRDTGAPIRAAQLLKRVHRLREVFESRFYVFDEIEDYVELLRGWLPALPQKYYEVRQRSRAARRALEASPVPLVPCHNDPWPGNLLDVGARTYLIDWEYSGMNDPMWDLGDLSVEAGFGPEQDRLMLEAYCDGAASPALYSRLELYIAMSDLHWSVWGFVQHTNDNPAEDFWSYALDRLERCTARMSSAKFDQHLDAVRTDRPPTRSLRPPPPPGATRPTGAPTKGSIR
jgi:thiamine kinase-like enzyme